MIVLLLSQLLAPAWAVAPTKLGDVTITELQSDTTAVPPYYGEWFEIYNNSGKTLTLNGLLIERSTQSLLIPASPPIDIGVGEYFVLGASAERNEDVVGYNGNVPVDYVYSYFTEFNIVSADDVLRVSYDGILLDEVDWDSTWAPTADEALQSQPNASANEWANDLQLNWCSSGSVIPSGPGMNGTPGGENDQCGDEYNVDNDGDGYAEFQGDCDDEHADINPDMIDGIEAPNGEANDDADCDGVRDDGVDDNDGDGWTEVDGDCDDADINTYPGAVEALDGDDDNCDECIDDLDMDHDGYSHTAAGAVNPCGDDCDDTNDAIHPGSQEIPYDGVDQDCNYLEACDEDHDGYDAVVDPNCVSPEGYCCDGFDCNDANADVHPGSVEDNGNGIDDDCDGIVDIPDKDGDGFTEQDGDCMDLGEAEGYPAAQVILSAQVNPTAKEVCFDQVDNDCDGWIDNESACSRDAAVATVRGGGLCGVVEGGAAGVLVLAGLMVAAARRDRRGV
ncbi:hypothetical protein LBMAG42_47650 [Deltaproteobacteria bacterium]|nr:hypothetical protein LBMAG42_47650 [Deltaproteobacteria bacterium]